MSAEESAPKHVHAKYVSIYSSGNSTIFPKEEEFLLRVGRTALTHYDYEDVASMDWTCLAPSMSEIQGEIPKPRWKLYDQLSSAFAHASIAPNNEMLAAANLADKCEGGWSAVFIRVYVWSLQIVHILHKKLHALENDAHFKELTSDKGSLYRRRISLDACDLYVRFNFSFWESQLDLYENSQDILDKVPRLCQVLKDTSRELDGVVQQQRSVNVEGVISNFIGDSMSSLPDLASDETRNDVEINVRTLLTEICDRALDTRQKLNRFLEKHLPNSYKAAHAVFERLKFVVDKRKEIVSEQYAQLDNDMRDFISQLETCERILHVISCEKEEHLSSDHDIPKVLEEVREHIANLKKSHLSVALLETVEPKARALLAQWHPRALLKNVSSLPDDFDVKDIECPICLQLFKDAVVASDGMVYCQNCIAECMAASSISPLTRKVFEHDKLIAALDKRRLVNQYKKWHGTDNKK